MATTASNTDSLDRLADKLTAFHDEGFTWREMKEWILQIITDQKASGNDITFKKDSQERSLFDYLINKDKNYLRTIALGLKGKGYPISLILALESCVDKRHDYADSEFVKRDIKYINPLTKMKDPVKSKFYGLLQSGIRKRLDSKTPSDFFKEYSRHLHIDESELLEFFVGNPVLLMSLIDEDFETIDEGHKKFPVVSKLYHFKPRSSTDLFVEIDEAFDDYHNGGNECNEELGVYFYKKNEREVKDKKVCSNGIFLGHSLSPFSESICLLYELGRFKRIAEIYDIDHKIFLTAPSWSKFNYSSAQIHSDESRRESVLRECSTFRETLYEKLGIAVEKIEDTDVFSKKGTIKINNAKIKQAAKEYANYANYIEKIGVSSKENRKYELLNIIKNLCNADSSANYIDRLPSEIKLLAYSIVDDKKNLFIIHTILRHFNSLDEDTFYYTLLQRYKQQAYKGWIKVAVESEIKFDAAFCKLDEVDGYSDSEIGAIYYKHYYFSKGKDGKPLNVIPYTFPSGRVWSRANSDIKEAIGNTILLWDFEENRQSKIYKLLENIDLKQLAIQICDLFSFCNYFFDGDFWLGNTDKFGNYHHGLNHLLDKLDMSCSKAWDKYRNDPAPLKTFSQYFMSMWFTEIELPYYFYPFIHVIRAKNEIEFEKRVRQTYSEIIIYTLEKLNQKITVREWK